MIDPKEQAKTLALSTVSTGIFWTIKKNISKKTIAWP
jgi:hypothetical protein